MEPLTSLWIEELSWPEIGRAMEHGYRRLLLCAASTEQHGPHLAENTDELFGRLLCAEVAKRLGEGVVCVGNGFNDLLMAEVCALSVCVIGREGCCGALLGKSDVVVTSIADGLDLLLKPDRLRATLRT